MKKYIYTTTLLILLSCGGNTSPSNEVISSNKTEYLFNSHEEILNVYKEIFKEEYIVKKTKSSSSYRQQIGDFKNKNADFKLINLNFRETSHNIEGVGKQGSGHDCLLFSGDFEIGETKTGVYRGYLSFYLPKGEDLSVQNILKHNELVFDDKFLRVEYRKGYSPQRIIESYLETGVDVINLNGEILKFNRYINLYGGGGFFLKEYIKDTLEFSTLVNGEKEGKSFKVDIFLLKNGNFVKYISNEGDYQNGKEEGIHISRSKGIVNREIVYENGKKTSETEYFDNIYSKTSDSIFKKETVGNLWSNQENFKINTDKKGYQSYTPLVKEIKNYKGFIVEGYDNKVYKLHGEWKKNQIIDGGCCGEIAKFVPLIRGTFKEGNPDGNFIFYNEIDGKESLNVIFENGKLISGVEKIYEYKDRVGDWSESYLEKTTTISREKISWVKYGKNGEVLDEGVQTGDLERARGMLLRRYDLEGFRF